MRKHKAPFIRSLVAAICSCAVGVAFLSQWVPSYYLEPWTSAVDHGFGFAINSQTRFWIAASFQFMSTIVDGYVRGKTTRWKRLYVSDPMVPRDKISSTDATIHLTIELYNLYVAFMYLVQTFFNFTNIYMFAIKQLACVFVSSWLTKDYLSDKRVYDEVHSV